MHETPEGFLVCVGVPIARTGEMIYGEGETPLVTDDEGKVIVTREEKDVFNPKTMASFEGKPITITHPTEFVTPQNWKDLAKGVIQNVRRGTGDQKNDLIADLLITDSMAINLVKNGLREVSCGYEASYSQDEDGEGKQSRIIGNHLALVDEGRAGSSYAINDHKGKGVTKMTLKEKFKSIFSKAQDEAMKMADEFGAKEDAKKDDSKDALSENDMGNGLSTYDELVKMCDDLSQKVAALKGAKDAEKKEDSKDEDKKDEEKKDEAKDDDQVEASIEDRLKTLEAAVQKLLESKASDADEEKKDDAKDADEDSEESEDEDMPANTMTGDTASRIEILAPGLKADPKVAKEKALKIAYGTKDGKKIIDSLTAGKPTFDSASQVEMLFISASELLKAERNSAFAATKGYSVEDRATVETEMTAEKMNERNAQFYKQA